MPTLAAARASNEGYSRTYLPVFVIFGGTSGIGEGIARAAARYSNGRAHIVIVGRNKRAAERILASMWRQPTPTEDDQVTVPPEATYEFIACDVNVMKNIHNCTEELKSRLTKINYLVLSAGVINLRNRDETEEGIDKKMASRFYSRFAITHGLLPLLRNAKELGEDVQVLSVLGPGWGPKSIAWDDLGLKKTYSATKAIKETIGYMDLMMQGYAEREPSIGFNHIYPGVVNTNLMTPRNPVLRLLWSPIAWLISVKPEVSAEWMFYALVNGKAGFWRTDDHAEDMGMRGHPDATDEQKAAFWKHAESLSNVF